MLDSDAFHHTLSFRAMLLSLLFFMHMPFSLPPRRFSILIFAFRRCCAATRFITPDDIAAIFAFADTRSLPR